MTSTPFSATILSPTELWRYVQNLDNLERLTHLLDERPDLVSQLHYFASLNQTIDYLQTYIDQQRQELNHVYTEMADPFFVGRIGPELF